MFKLLKDVECYTPAYMGRRHILVVLNKVAAILSDIPDRFVEELHVIDCRGKIACPGWVDQHVHISGGGGEQGPQSSIAPICLEMLTTAGVTTVVGLLGADAIGKSMQNLLIKARALEEEGLTAYIYAGHYGIPPATITGRIITDIALIEKIIGAGEIAISDFRSACPSLNELMKLAHETLTGGMLGKKAGVMHLHVGDGKDGLDPLLELLEMSDFPVSMFVPTHLNRNRKLFRQAVQYWENGGNIDLTAGENTMEGCSVSDCLQELIHKNKELERVTLSSDGNGSGAGISHNGINSVMSLSEDIRKAVKDYGMPLETVLRIVTVNVAKVLKLYPEKGCIAVGSDADILVLDSDTLIPDMLLAGGRLLVENGKPIKSQQ